MRLALACLVFGAVCVPRSSAAVQDEADASVDLPEAPAAPRPLDHADYDRWNRLSGQTLSGDGAWVAYTLRPGEGDSTLVVRSVHGTTRYDILRGTSARFTEDSRYVAYLVAPDPDEVKKARKEKKKDEEQPKNSLELLDLTTGDIHTVARVRSFQLPEDGATALAYLTEKDPPAPEPAAEKSEEGEEPAIAGAEASSETAAAATSANAAEETTGGETKAETKPAETTSEPTEAKAQETKPASESEGKEEGKEEEGEKKEKDEYERDPPGTDLVLLHLPDLSEHRFEHVTSYRFNEGGSHVVFTCTPANKREDGLWILDTTTGRANPIAQGLGKYQNVSFDKAGTQVAFLTTRHGPEEKPERWSLDTWSKGDAEAVERVTDGTAGVPEGWGVASSRGPSFSESGARLQFGTKLLPPKEEEEEEGDESEEEEDEDEDPEVKVDVWHWQDPLLQPMQLRQVNRVRNQTFLAVLTLDDNRVVQLADETLPNVTIGERGDSDLAVGNSNLPYRKESSWDSPGYSDAYLVDVATGDRTRVLERLQARPQLSPTGRFLFWFDRIEQHWFAMSTKTKQTVNLTELLPYPVHNELHDTPSRAGAYGSVGWSDDDRTLIVYDKYDLWATNPTGFWPPFCITDGMGRDTGIRFRYVRMDPDERAIPTDVPLLLSAFDTGTKASGFFTDRVRANEPPHELVRMDERISTPRKAEHADVYLVTRSTFRNYPDVWATDPEFRDFVRLSDANPQQAEYTWGDSELYEWTALSGESLQGILIKPDGFDPAQQYPMMVYFYERSSDRLHSYVVPAPGSSSINWSFYASRGYLVFVPDIPYRIGYPGQSAECSILSGVSSLIREGFVDEERIGVQGHSWGGYQVAHLVTQSNIFACAESGAPVSNMTSAYGGIRWSSGMSRMFQYEKTQSRIGATLWEALPKYLENSPIFHADKIETPLLILHNDEDGAVPWYQGIELFVAMRRLSKPCWMFNYNGEAHGLRQKHNQKDWTIRMQQFFDHYLKDAPPPEWLAHGIPAVEKGENLGLDLVEPTDRR